MNRYKKKELLRREMRYIRAKRLYEAAHKDYDEYLESILSKERVDAGKEKLKK